MEFQNTVNENQQNELDIFSLGLNNYNHFNENSKVPHQETMNQINNINQGINSNNPTTRTNNKGYKYNDEARIQKIERKKETDGKIRTFKELESKLEFLKLLLKYQESLKQLQCDNKKINNEENLDILVSNTYTENNFMLENSAKNFEINELDLNEFIDNELHQLGSYNFEQNQISQLENHNFQDHDSSEPESMLCSESLTNNFINDAESCKIYDPDNLISEFIKTDFKPF